MQVETVRDLETPSDVRALMDAIAAGSAVDGTELVRELERMLRQVEAIDADFDSLGIFFRRRTPLEMAVGPGSDVHDVYELGDETVVVHTSWLVSARGRFCRKLGEELAPWLDEHDDPRGIPCFRISQLEIVLSAESYDDALYLLGDSVVWIRVPDPLAETQGH